MSLYSKSTFKRLQYLEYTIAEFYKAIGNSKSSLLDKTIQAKLGPLNKEYDILKVKGALR